MKRFEVSFESYGNYSSSTYGVNTMLITDSQGNRFWFSYKTMVAFEPYDRDLVCIQNYWQQTTGKHLNWIQPDKSKRVDRATFDRLYQLWGESEAVHERELAESFAKSGGE
jgi:hypothetical protein